MSEHTPGPWIMRKAKFASDGGFDFGIAASVDGNMKCIAETFEVVGEERAPAEANGRLIAAAPDMLAALIAVQRDEKEFRCSSATTLGLVDAVIAKAKGNPA
jgi:hypothetical protein